MASLRPLLVLATFLCLVGECLSIAFLNWCFFFFNFNLIIDVGGLIDSLLDGSNVR